MNAPAGRGVPRNTAKPVKRPAPGCSPSVAPSQNPPAKLNPPSQQMAEQPFTTKVRRVVDYRLRNPHRRFVHEKLLRIIAHWTQVPASTLPLTQTVPVDLKIASELSVPPVERVLPSGPCVNARALLVLGLTDCDELKGKHPIRRMELLAGQTIAEGKQTVGAYGGLCSAGTDTEVIAQLIEMLKEQCGMDLSDVVTWHRFVEVQYRDNHPTIFYVPCLWESPSVTCCPQAHEEKEEKEEEIEEEEIDEEATERKREEERQKIKNAKKAEGGEEGKEGEPPAEEEVEVVPVMKKVKRKQMVEVVKKEETIVPVKLSLADLLDYQVHKTTPVDTLELCSAADALDEFLKREYATKLLEVFRLKREEHEERQRVIEEQKAVQERRKREREEEQEARKQRRKERDEKLRAEWEEDDEGKTDEEKAEAMEERRGILKEIQEQDAKEDREFLAAWVEPPPEAKKLVEETRAELLEPFVYFDRTMGYERLTGTMSLLRVENILLCIDEEMTIEELRQVLDIPQVGKGHAAFNYRNFAKVIKAVEPTKSDGQCKMEVDAQ